MKKDPAKRSNLFLLELILAIFFFALASAVCILFFVQARALSRETHTQNEALVCAKNLSAFFESQEGSLTDIADNFPESSLEDSRLEIFYDENWNLCSEEEKSYLASLTLSGSSYEDHLLEGEIQVSDGSEVFCILDVSCYIPLQAGEQT
ncbi:MAG TPA: hypothetical protein H9935_07515 [Candidatus Blautia merdigallinarum]|uniref:Type II secretion system protein n=1 Tax=Candidatus Blautia merdigallinarum TaxID=2838495 RepID=A0A9D2SKR1_9FIRM|nr:hypothetical protein [Candidatus Blautia merdigallinarum]